ncbi:DUF560 domain-containing protein [Cardiobacteriaceae bacterium TAE3-ERU3]|nr:DUF560 domain-containing protein [Cardiobacteriaceae bacterium TAE3-ERU3]
MQRHSPLFLAIILIGNLAFAQTQLDNDLLIPSDSPKPGDKDFVPPPKQPKEENIIDEAMLRSNPLLLAKLLDQAVMTGQIEAVVALLPLYEEVSNKDEQLARYARAAVAQRDGRTKDAIQIYREMLAENGDLPPVRLQLAMALAADRQDGAAEDQFMRLRHEELPAEVSQLIDQQLTSLQERREWSFNFSSYYQADNNINNAPPQRQMAWGNGTLTFAEPVKAKGFHYYVSADKMIPIDGGVFGGINASISGDHWNKSDYNDMNITLGTTLGWRDTRRNARVNPFVRRRIFAGEAYSTSVGVNLGGDYWVTPNWRLSTNGLLSNTKHDKRTFLDGNQYYGGISALYAPTAGRYFFGGVGAYRNATDDPSDTYNRPSINLGWGEEWSHGISTRLSGSISKRSYAGPDIFNIKREDREYSVSFSIWKRDWHFWGITPKLNLDWSKSTSNHFYYDNKQSKNAYIEFSKLF